MLTTSFKTWMPSFEKEEEREEREEEMEEREEEMEGEGGGRSGREWPFLRGICKVISVPIPL